MGRRFRRLRHLLADQAAKILCEEENRAEDKFAERRAEDAAPICERHIACDQFRKEGFVESDRT